MINWIWGCMIISIKGIIGGLFWVLFIIISLLIIGVVFGSWQKYNSGSEGYFKKPKWKGQDILIKGGRNEKKK